MHENQLGLCRTYFWMDLNVAILNVELKVFLGTKYQVLYVVVSAGIDKIKVAQKFSMIFMKH